MSTIFLCFYNQLESFRLIDQIFLDMCHQNALNGIVSKMLYLLFQILLVGLILISKLAIRVDDQEIARRTQKILAKLSFFFNKIDISSNLIRNDCIFNVLAFIIDLKLTFKSKVINQCWCSLLELLLNFFWFEISCHVSLSKCVILYLIFCTLKVSLLGSPSFYLVSSVLSYLSTDSKHIWFEIVQQGHQFVKTWSFGVKVPLFLISLFFFDC